MAAPTIDVAPSEENRRVVITVTADAGSLITVYRTAGGATTTVRGAVDVETLGESVFVDYELPQDTALAYYATATLAEVTQETAPESAGSFDFGGDVLYDLSQPWNGLVVQVESFPSLEYGVKRDVIDVWDRPDPVVVSGVRQYPSGRLTLITDTLADRALLLDVVQSGTIVGLSPHGSDYGLDGVVYLSLGKVVEQRVADFAAEPTRKWSIDVQQIRQPPGSYLFPFGTVLWGDYAESETTWGDLSTMTWLEVAGI